jgi:hypothetical protein
MQLLKGLNILQYINKDIWPIIFKYVTDYRDFSSLALASRWLLLIAKKNYVTRFNIRYRRTVRCLILNPHYKQNEVREGISYRQAMGSYRLYYCHRVPTIVPSPKRVNTVKTVCEISYSRTSRRNGPPPRSNQSIYHCL